MKTYDLNWSVGYTFSPDAVPEETYPARVPGAAQLDYAAHRGWEPFYKSVNCRNYAWMEDVYWHYTADLDFTLEPGQTASLEFRGIDYKYCICINGEVLCREEGMFAPVTVDVSKYAGIPSVVEVLIDPVPKADDSNTRSQARKSCKSAACYGWDWHPRLVTAGLWDEAHLVIRETPGIREVQVSYRLNESLDRCVIRTEILPERAAAVQISLWLEGQEILTEEFGVEEGKKAGSYSMELENPRLWNPNGYGEQPLYTLKIAALAPDGSIGEQVSRFIGFRRSRLVMNEGSWDLPNEFPKSRSDAPATFEINGRRIFAKGSNWVNAQVFPGEMTEEHYDQLLTLVKEAHMNTLRIWGGGFINKESFYDLCDQKGIMVWQEFPLACNEYPDDEEYLAVLEKEATAIVRRLRTHPCLVLWCGGNELFNNWSRMTDQHHALRLLDSICYREDRDTPFIMTSPLNGMAHGHYMNYDEESGKEFITLLTQSHNTAYTEFGCPAVSDVEQLKSFLTEEEYEAFGPDSEAWICHHGFGAWRLNCWVRIPEVEYFFGGYTDKEDLFRKTEQLQCMSYRSCFEEMRKQWPHCSMALNWCLNEPWPTVGNNSLISWPAKVRPAYDAVKNALRPTLASLRVEHHLWHGLDCFQAEIWMLHDAPEELPEGRIAVSYSLGEGPVTVWGTLNYGTIPAQTNFRSGMITFQLPEDFEGEIHIRLDVEDHPEMSSEYTYLCRKKEAGFVEDMLNM